MFGRFAGFWFDEEVPFKALLTGIVFRGVEEFGEVFLLAFHVGVKQGHITFTTAPEHIVFSPKGNGSINSRFYLCARMGQHMKVGVSSCAVHIPAVTEQGRGTPKQFYATGGLFLFGVFN